MRALRPSAPVSAGKDAMAAVIEGGISLMGTLPAGGLIWLGLARFSRRIIYHYELMPL